MARKLPDLTNANKSWAEQAEDFVAYYEFCVENSGPSWLLGLFMARQWRRLINEPQPNLEEARLMIRALDAERPNQGSGWSDMYWRARKWLEEVEASSNPSDGRGTS